MVLRFVLGALILIPLPCTLLAQSDSLKSNIYDLSLEELLDLKISSATKRNEKIEDIPASIHIVTRSDIEKSGHQSLEELFENLNGIFPMGSSWVYGGNNYGFRGHSSPGAFNDIMILVDGVNQIEDYANSFNLDKINIPINAIDRIEFVRGPMSVIYGSNAFMGSINIITNSSYDKNIVSSKYGSLNTFEQFVRFKGKENNLDYSFNISFKQSDGQDYLYSRLISDTNKLKVYSGSINSSTKGHLNSNSLFFNGNIGYKDFTFSFGHTSNDVGVLNFLPSSSDKGFIVNNKGVYMMVKCQRYLNEKFSILLKYGFQNHEQFSPEIHVLGETYGNFFVGTNSHEFESNLIFHPVKNFNILWGNYTRVSPEILTFGDVSVIAKDRTITLDRGEKVINFGTFAQANYQYKKINLIAGVRFENANNYNLLTQKKDPVTDSLIVLDFTSRNESWQVIPRLAAVYKINPNNTMKFLFGISKKRASLREQVKIAEVGAQDLDLATLTSFEINYFARLKQSATVNFSLFYNDLNNLLLTKLGQDELGNFFTYPSSSGVVSTIGAEVNAIVLLSKDFNLDFGGTFLQSKGNSNMGNEYQVPFSPNLLGHLKLIYNLTENISIYAKWRYVDEMFSEYDEANESSITNNSKAYSIIDFNIRVNNFYKGFYSSLGVTNAFNSEIRYPGYSINKWADLGVLGYGQRINVNLGYKFNN